MVMLCTAPLLPTGPPPLPPTEMYAVTHSRIHLRTPSETLPRGIFVPRSKIRHHSNAVIVYSRRTVAPVSCCVRVRTLVGYTLNVRNRNAVFPIKDSAEHL